MPTLHRAHTDSRIPGEGTKWNLVFDVNPKDPPRLVAVYDSATSWCAWRTVRACRHARIRITTIRAASAPQRKRTGGSRLRQNRPRSPETSQIHVRGDQFCTFTCEEPGNLMPVPTMPTRRCSSILAVPGLSQPVSFSGTRPANLQSSKRPREKSPTCKILTCPTTSAVPANTG